LPASVVSAHSVARQINTAYTGDLIRVRRASDNAEADIGFDGSGNLDETALLAHTGTGTGDHGFVVRIYEQSEVTGAVDFIQTTAALQPPIVQDGVVVKANGVPVIVQPTDNGSGNHEYMVLDSWGVRPSNATVFQIMSLNSTVGSRRSRAAPMSNDSGNLFPGARQGSSNTTITQNAGTPDIYKDGTLIAASSDGTTQNDLWTKLGDVNVSLLRMEGADLSAADWAALRTKPASTFFDGAYYVGDIIIADSPSASDISTIESRMSAHYYEFVDIKAVTLGDSVIAEFNSDPSVISLVDNLQMTADIIAEPGDSIANQKSKWVNRSIFTAEIGVVIVQVGLNDMNTADGRSSADVIADLQDLVDTIKNNVAGPIYVAKLTPAYARWQAIYGASAGDTQQRWEDLNEAIAGAGATPITNVDGRITAHETEMNDGSGNLKAIYDSGDGIHPNTAGRQVIADEWATVIRGDGVPL
jgi:lysophospholipase L1-like esterase